MNNKVGIKIMEEWKRRVKDLYVVNIDIPEGIIYFNNGIRLKDFHVQDCCESHYWDLNHLNLDDFRGLTFDLSTDDFFERIKDYGIQLIANNDIKISIPCYGYNNGYYSSYLSFRIVNDLGHILKEFDITDSQKIIG